MTKAAGCCHRIDLAERHLGVPKKDTAIWELFKQFSVSARVGLVCGLLGGLLGAVVGIAAAPFAGSIFVGFMLVILLGGMWMGFGPQIKRNRLVSRGVRTQATLLAINETGVTVQQNYGLAKLQLRVEPPDGGEPYEVTTKTLINRFDIPSFQPGAVLEVVVDPKDRSKVAVV